MSVFYMEHPLIKHKITMLRDEKKGTNEFRKLVEEIAMLMGYEALSDLKMREVEIKTPIEDTVQPVLDGKKPAVVPILRAGLGMVNGILALLPSAKVGHIGMCRDEVTHKPQTYYCKLPNFIEDRLVIVTDPMLATGGSAVAAINAVKKRGYKNIRLMCLVGVKEGIENVHKHHPEVDIFIAAVDEKLNDKGYILPGLGDAGDRIFGTK